MLVYYYCMNELLHDSRRLLVLIFITAIIGFLDLKELLNWPKASLQYLTSPIQLGLYKTSSVATKQFEFIIKARTAAMERQALHEQLAHVLSENANLRRKLAETGAMLSQEKTLNPQTFNSVPARPIGFTRFLKIDKGSNDGIKPGQAVVFKDNLLGEIRKVSPKEAEVILISDPESKVATFVTSDEGKARGILLGQFGSELLLDKILHNESINKGDLVYSEGTEGKFPRGLVLGQVAQVVERQNQVFKQAKVKAVFDIGDLDLVFVITD